MPADSPFVKVLKDATWAAYRDAYGRIRARYDWNDPPVVHGQHIDEPLPPRHLSGEAYSPYFADVLALGREYGKAMFIAGELGKKRLPKVDGVEDVRGLLEHNLKLQLGILRGTS